MKEGWKKVKIEEIGEVISGGTPKTSILEYWNGDIVWLTPKDFSNNDNKYWKKGERNITREGLKNSSARLMPKGTILFSSRAPIGYLGIAEVELCTNQGFKNLIVNQNYDNEFIYYLLKYETTNIENIANGSTFKEISATTFKNYEVFIPNNKNIQKKIASILSSLDEKIELNRKINQNLEEICQNYFVEIFIKNSNKNCSIGQISDLGNIVSGATPSKKNQKYYTNFGIPWITPKDLSKISNKFISRGNLDITELGFKNSSVRLLPKGSVLFSSRAPIGYIAICSNDVTTNQGFKSIVPFKNIGTEFVYYFLKNNVQFLESRASGSTFKEISTTIMATTPAIIPKEEPLKVFKKICVNIFEKQYIIEKETEKLIELRDYLLPRLMSGEIDVSNLKISEILNSDLSFYLVLFSLK